MKRLLLVLLFILAAACHRQDERTSKELTAGDPAKGKQAIASYGCGACHQIKGVDGANGMVGPPLNNIGSRTMLAGQLPNSPDNMIKWIRTPQEVESGTSMPNLGVTENDGRDIAAYLYTLRE
ncbi:MAG TPA: c-type cytochrome [Thermoanaerobaculia bacterium]|nr:c-type cytochrome [Thermoanaerobaculia bacterium]